MPAKAFTRQDRRVSLHRLCRAALQPFFETQFICYLRFLEELHHFIVHLLFRLPATVVLGERNFVWALRLAFRC